MLAAVILAVPASGHDAPGCNTHRCDRHAARLWLKHHPPRGRIAIASYYSPADSGGPLACGGGDLTWSTLGVANKTLPCGHWLIVCARRCLRVPVVDRGPFITGREFDLTIATARAIGFNLAAGYGPVRVIGG